MNSYSERALPAELAARAGRTDERWLEFLQIVQASELSSLANTLAKDLVSFIKQVLNLRLIWACIIY